MKTYLVMRFSAMGDVILLLPVLVAAIEQNPDAKFVVLTRPKFATFFEGYSNIEVFKADVDGEYKSFFSLFTLVKNLKSRYKFEAVLDLHQHVRTGFLKLLFLPLPSFTLNKGRSDKKAITSTKEKVRKQLKHTTERYADVLRKAGIKVETSILTENQFFKQLPALPIRKNKKWIGIAPFAQHQGKMWPLEMVKQVVKHLQNREDVQVLLLGGGVKEKAQLEEFAHDFSNVESLVSKYSMKEELAIISQLDVMLCMDSSNMHLASLAGVPTVSIWGATHPDLGFGPFGSQKHVKIQVPEDELSCRPCSVYGNKPCFRGDYACLHRIDETEVVKNLEKLIA